MKLVRTLSATAGVLTLKFMFASQAFAQSLGVPQPDGFEIEDLGLLVSRMIAVALMIAGILVFVYLVWGGIQWITSGGDKAKTEEARARITAALVGLAIVAAAWAVMQLIAYFFGISVIGGNPDIPRGFD